MVELLDVTAMLGAEGPFASLLPGFSARSVQQQMAGQVAEALDNDGTLVCEAGTGTGKTFAYLVPALLSGRRVVISTGTRNLQDQLFHRDLPTVRKALRLPVQVALLKGRANYLCVQRLKTALEEGSGSRARQHMLLAVRSWADRTDSGDIAEMTEIPEDAFIWPQVTSTADNCLGQECPVFSECHVVRARREAQAAEVVVVNHHLFLADLALKEQGFGEVLPGHDAVIFDEAHQLPDVATHFFGRALSSRQLQDLSRDSVQAHIVEAGDVPALRECAYRVDRQARDLRLALGGSERRAGWREVEGEKAVSEALAALAAGLSDLHGQLEPAAARGPALANCLKRCETMAADLRLFEGTTDADAVTWFETHSRGFILYQTPLDISDQFNARLNARPGARIFTSATLAVRKNFAHFKAQLGIADSVDACYESPFDFARQALLYLPALALDPREAGYTETVVEASLPVLEASGGRAFMLFTSHRALKAAENLLRARADYPLLVQGEAPRAELVERFRRTARAVLLGTTSFWEGVDVRGEALSLVIIDKLPFAPPDDPVMQARIEALRRQERNAFTEQQLPEAVILLKQGVGRLIRDVTDRGVMMICDPRLRSKSYGKIFLASLPPMRRTATLGDVVQFFESEPSNV